MAVTVGGLLLQVHLSLSLVFGVVILIACVTGATLKAVFSSAWATRHRRESAMSLAPPGVAEAPTGNGH
jgi:hypothetical protein